MLNTAKKKMIDSFYLNDLKRSITYLEDDLDESWNDDQFDELVYSVERLEKGEVPVGKTKLTEKEVADIKQSFIEGIASEIMTARIIEEMGRVEFHG